MIIYNGYSDKRFLELSELDCESELEKELWRRLNAVYIGYENEDSEYYGMTHEELIDEINSIKSDNHLLESDLEDAMRERDDFEEALDEADRVYETLETSYANIITEYLSQICADNESNEELVSKIKQAKYEIVLCNYKVAVDYLNELCYDDLKNRYPLLSTILHELEQYAEKYSN